MLKKLALTSTLAVGLALTGNAQAADFEPLSDYDNWYIGVFGGGVFSHPSFGIYDGDVGELVFHEGFAVGGIAGTEVLPGLRGELELAYQRYKANETLERGQRIPMDGKASTFTAMLNLWKDFYLTGPITPYVGGGLGVGLSDVRLTLSGQTNDEPEDFDRVDGSDVALAAQVGAGARMAVSDRLSLDLGYRFRVLYQTFTQAIERENGSLAGESAIINFHTHTLQAGITYQLGGPRIEPVADYGYDNWYASVFGGVLLMPDRPIANDDESYVADFGTGFTVGAAIGKELVPGLRGEAEVSYLRTEPERNLGDDANGEPKDMDGHLDQVLFLMNLWKDVPLGVISAYIGGGLGFGILDAQFDELDDFSDGRRVGLAGQFGAGVRFAATDNTSVDFGYRFKGMLNTLTPNAGVPGSDDALGTYTGHVIQGGATYHMGGARVEPVGGPGPSVWYAGIFGGGVFGAETALPMDDNVDYRFDTGFTVGAVIGTEVTDGLRGEVEFSYLNAEPGKSTSNLRPFLDSEGHHQQFLVLANLWKDIDLADGFTPYLGGGIGIGVVDIDTTVHIDEFGSRFGRVIDTQAGLAFQVGAGVRTDVSDGVTLDAGYRFKAVMDILMRGTDSPEFSDDNGYGTIEAHVLQAGVTMDMN